MCNGTRLQITNLKKYVIEAKILPGSFTYNIVLISRIPLTTNDDVSRLSPAGFIDGCQSVWHAPDEVSTKLDWKLVPFSRDASPQLVGLIKYFPSWIFKYFHMCSIGLRSGDCAGQFKSVPSSSVKSTDFKYALVTLAVCFGSLSC
ncbi:hypothetical protein KI688_006607 [Linnemannia hyalina]|uniref:Uncharacterized protein n=1 Tax=Linnemannia hyalina TaxID=64524 RepID=A0A9P8BNI5_9FUNG|nr:hypothetical protein KI688_006607 [Linnemannia hyalina]